MEEESASTDDCKSTRDSKKLNKHSFQFGLLAADGASFKFRVRDEREHRTWTNLIKFLSMFPHSVVPEIPSYDPPAAMGNLGPTLYNKGRVSNSKLQTENFAKTKCSNLGSYCCNDIGGRHHSLLLQWTSSFF